MVVMYHVSVGLLSTSQLKHNEVRLICVNLLLDLHCQFYLRVSCEYLRTPICLDHIGLHPNRCQVNFEDQRKMCVGLRLLGTAEIEY